jgi:hypothetical protein
MMKKRLFQYAIIIPVFLALTFVPTSLKAQDAKPFLGTWDGALGVMGVELKITVKLSLDEEQNIQGTIDIPEQGAMDLPLGDFALDGKKISFKIASVQGDPTFSGELDETGKKIAGEFS